MRSDIPYEEKLKNFPTVNYISLHDSLDRRDYMESQFIKYGIRGVAHINHLYKDMRDNVQVIPDYAEQWIGSSQLGITISHLSMIRNWVETTDEPYAIFCEDDISFRSIEYWNFTWDEFMSNLPKAWQCVQLIRMESPFTLESFDRMRLNLRDSFAFGGRWWGASWMMTREYALHIVNQHYPSPGIFHLWHYNVMPIPENILFYYRGYPVYNFPLLYEKWQDFTTRNNSNEEDIDARSGRNLSQQITEHLWICSGSNLNLKESMAVE